MLCETLRSASLRSALFFDIYVHLTRSSSLCSSSHLSLGLGPKIFKFKHHKNPSNYFVLYLKRSAPLRSASLRSALFFDIYVHLTRSSSLCSSSHLSLGFGSKVFKTFFFVVVKITNYHIFDRDLNFS
ncbi:hypothetical protein JYU34_019202 [Plutella xylostella]|uniref:Uncharacterized protein n=1 Tax=Plutella xylostella TaxID=51655 RepID=A0ABQ7PXP2_PLUXY|nr:hypothetical protein JYU34_019202 [Plutella xylostella]